MKKFMFFLSLFFLFVFQTQAQKEINYSIPKWRLGIEAGVYPVFATINKPEMIRENRSYYFDQDYDYHCGFVSDRNNIASYSFGLRPEFLIKKRLALSTGLRFSFFTVALNSDKDYFLWKVNETETSANYVKIKNISQKNYYLGIPLEVKLYPREKDYAVRHYFVFGTAFSFLVASKAHIEFMNSKMEKYSSNILEYIGQPTRFQASIYAGAGLKFGKMNAPFGNIEFFFPVITFGENRANAFTKINTIVGFKIQTTLQVPVSKKYRLEYRVID